MSTAFLELPEHLRWNPIPGSNRAIHDPATGGFLEVVKAHPFPPRRILLMCRSRSPDPGIDSA